MSPLFWSILSAIIVSAISLIGVTVLFIKDKLLDRILILLVAFAAGAMIGGAFFHLLPESLEMTDNITIIFVYAMIGFVLFFILEKVLRWHHCHDDECPEHRHLGTMNLVGDGVHNFIDGMVIFAAFVVSPALGLAVVISVILHEVPQELSDFGVLLYAGVGKMRALMYNFISGLMSIVGVLVALLLFNMNQSVGYFLVPFAAGGFIYIAASDLIPELHQENKLGKSVLTLVVFIVALVFMWGVKIIFE